MRHRILQQSWRWKDPLSDYLWTFGWQESCFGRISLEVVDEVGFGAQVGQTQPRVNGGLIKPDMEIGHDGAGQTVGVCPCYIFSQQLVL